MAENLRQARLARYDELVAACPDFDRQGKTMAFTSANGYMFSQLNKAGELGIRLPKDEQERFIETHGTGPFTSYGATMRDYVRVPEAMLDDTEAMLGYLNASYAYVMSLPPK